MSSRGTPIWVRADGRGAGMWEPWRLRPTTVLQGGGGQDQRRCCIAPVQAPGVFSYADLVHVLEHYADVAPVASDCAVGRLNLPVSGPFWVVCRSSPSRCALPRVD